MRVDDTTRPNLTPDRGRAGSSWPAVAVVRLPLPGQTFRADGACNGKSESTGAYFAGEVCSIIQARNTSPTI